MNQEFREVLFKAGFPDAFDQDVWSRIVLIRNNGRVPPAAGKSGESEAPGFKLLLLGRDGRPMLFARCGWSQDASLLRESALLESLQKVPACRRLVPRVCVASSSRLHIQLSPYLGNRPYSNIMQNQGPKAWASCVLEILDISSQVMNYALRVVADLKARFEHVAIQSSSEADLGKLAASGVATSVIIRLRKALVPLYKVAPCLQHGDLWPENVLRDKAEWRLIDFAECGQVWVPLYDAFHMLFNGPATASTRPWFAMEYVPHDPWAIARFTVLRELAARSNLCQDEVDSALVYYLVHLAAYRLRPGVPREYSAYLIAYLERVGEFLARQGGLTPIVPVDPDR